MKTHNPRRLDDLPEANEGPLWMTIPARSFYPLATIVIIAGAACWGPWISLGLALLLLTLSERWLA